MEKKTHNLQQTDNSSYPNERMTSFKLNVDKSFISEKIDKSKFRMNNCVLLKSFLSKSEGHTTHIFFANVLCFLLWNFLCVMLHIQWCTASLTRWFCWLSIWPFAPNRLSVQFGSSFDRDLFQRLHSPKYLNTNAMCSSHFTFLD